MKIKYIAIFLILLCCFVGAVSATEDVSSDVVNATIDDTATIETVHEETSDNYIEEDSSQEILKSNSDESKLSGEDVVYVDPTDTFALSAAMGNVNDGGTIYVPEGTYKKCNFGGSTNSYTMIGLNKDNTIISPTNKWVAGGSTSNPHVHTIYINLTFINSGNFNNDVTFINCTFINFKTTDDINYQIYRMWQGAPENVADIENSYVTNFVNCDFINSTVEGNFINADRFTQINFNECTFNNITATSLVSNVGGFTLQDGIYFSDCTFTNVNVKGIADVPKNTIVGTEDGSRVRIENSKGITGSDMLTVGDRDYINSTTSRVDSVLVANVNNEEKLVVSLKDAENNVIDGAEVFISVNGGETSSYAIEDDGTLTIAVSDLTTTTGSITITVEFKETDAYNGNSTTVTYIIRNATSITADNVTTTVGEAKNITVTLKDNNDKPIAGKTITVIGQDITATTDANGVANIPVNVDKAGVSEYTLFFAGDNTTYKNSTLVVKVTIKEKIIPNETSITANDINTTVGTAANITLTLKDNNGKPIAGKEIKVTVNGQNSTVTTDSNGVANIPVSADKAGVSEYTLFFAGDDINYKNSTLVVKVNVTEKSTTPVNNATNGTNTTPTQPTQQQDKKTTTTTTKKVTPVSTKITAKKATFKAKKKTKKYTITLKAGKKAVAKVKVTIKVGKKTYTAKTNTKGKATFNLKKLTKKGKYTAVIKFKGNKNYKATTKKVKITVKK